MLVAGPAIKICSLLLAISACAGGITEHMPRGGTQLDSAQVVVLRNRNYFGSGNAVEVWLNGKTIAKLRIGQYIQFWVPPGTHLLGVAAWRRSGWETPS